MCGCSAPFHRVYAGIEGERAATHESSTDNWDAVMGVNARGCYLCLRAEIRQMLQQSPPTASAFTAESEAEGPREGTAAPRVAIDRLNYAIVNIRLSSFTHMNCTLQTIVFSLYRYGILL